MALDWHIVACGCMTVLGKLFQETYSATVNEGVNPRAGPPDEVLHALHSDGAAPLLAEVSPQVQLRVPHTSGSEVLWDLVSMDARAIV